jgi:Flp pilus assembly protein TadB
MLARNVQKMDGLQKVIALTNLATLLREEQKHQQAMRLYRQTLWPLIRLKAGMQLAAVFSEMSNIYRDRGQLLRALAFQELSRVLRRVS